MRITFAVVQKMVEYGARLPQEFLAGLEEGLLDPFNEPPFDPLDHHDFSKSALDWLTLPTTGTKGKMKWNITIISRCHYPCSFKKHYI